MSDVESAAWIGLVAAAPFLGGVFFIIYRFGWSAPKYLLDLIPIDDEIPHLIERKIQHLVSKANMLNMDINKAEAHVWQLARQGICDAYNEHFPKRKPYTPKKNWPQATVIIADVVGVGAVATIKPWVGHDYDDSRAIHAVVCRVQLKSEVVAFKKVANAPPQKSHPEEWPTGRPKLAPLTRLVDRNQPTKSPRIPPNPKPTPKK